MNGHEPRALGRGIPQPNNSPERAGTRGHVLG
jgi:hypothetical protein